MGKGVVPLPQSDPKWITPLTPEQGEELARQLGLTSGRTNSAKKAFEEGQRMNMCIDDDVAETLSNQRGDPVLRLNCAFNSSMWTLQQTPNGLVLGPAKAPYLQSSGGGGSGAKRGRKGWTDNPELFWGTKPPAWKAGLYAVFDRATGKFLKWGITENPTRRYPGGKLEDGTEIRMSMFMHFDTTKSARKFEGWLVTRFAGPRNQAEIRQYGGRVAPTEYDFALFSSMLPHVYQTGG